MRNDGAAGGKGRCGLAGDHGGGEIPRRHDADDAESLATDDHLGSGKMAGDAFGVEALSFLSIPLDERGRIVDLGTGLGKRLALFQRHQQRKISAGLQDQVMPLAQDRGALLRQHASPGG
ncbi:hypothetical protein D9M68_309890 [compost metagenome]